MNSTLPVSAALASWLQPTAEDLGCPHHCIRLKDKLAMSSLPHFSVFATQEVTHSYSHQAVDFIFLLFVPLIFDVALHLLLWKLHAQSQIKNKKSDLMLLCSVCWFKQGAQTNNNFQYSMKHTADCCNYITCLRMKNVCSRTIQQFRSEGTSRSHLLWSSAQNKSNQNRLLRLVSSWALNTPKTEDKTFLSLYLSIWLPSRRKTNRQTNNSSYIIRISHLSVYVRCLLSYDFALWEDSVLILSVPMGEVVALLRSLKSYLFWLSKHFSFSQPLLYDTFSSSLTSFMALHWAHCNTQVPSGGEPKTKESFLGNIHKWNTLCI